MRPSASSSRAAQRGGFFIGLVVGVLVGLAVALGVALYVTKVPVPFINKVPQRTAEQDAAETEKNKHWDPNAPLIGKSPVRPAPAGSQPGAPAAPPVLPGPGALPSAAAKPASGAAGKDPAAILAGTPTAAESTASAPDALVYFVQAGAYGRTEEAEAQRAKLAIQGFESRISEREQAGRTMYRVRIGPFSQRADAEQVKATLAGAGMESALVRVQK
ncbi:MAG TPA: SPOR domain-containing protein [Methylibium sp.]|nr:SPOR domain-containing protein [Methylibium sp.]